MMAIFRGGQAPEADADAAGKVEDMCEAVEAANTAKNVLNAALEAETKRADAVEARLKQLETQTQAPDAALQVDDAITQLKEETARREKAETDAAELQAQLQTMKEEFKLEADRAEEALSKCSSVAARLEEAERAAASPVSDKQADDFHASNDGLEEEINEHETSLKDLQTHHADQLAEMKRKTVQLAEHAKQQLQMKSTQVEELSKAHAVTNAELEESATRLKEETARREKAETDAAELQAQLQTMEEEALSKCSEMQIQLSEKASQSAQATSFAVEAQQKLQNRLDATISALKVKLENAVALATKEKVVLQHQHAAEGEELRSAVRLLTASEGKLKLEVEALRSLAGDTERSETALTAAEQEKTLLRKQVAKMKEETQKSTQRREKMLMEAVSAEREAWEAQLEKMKVDHTREKAMMENMMRKVDLTPDVFVSPPVHIAVPREYEDLATRLQEAEKLIDVQQSNLVQKEKELLAMKNDPSGSVVWELRDRLDKSENLVVMQREMIKTKDEQLKMAIDSAMGAAEAAEETTRHPDTRGSETELLKQVARLTQEKGEVLEKAKQAVDELTSQLARTRSAREKDLQRRVTTCEEAINNLKQQATIDLQATPTCRAHERRLLCGCCVAALTNAVLCAVLYAVQVKNFLAERVQQLETPNGFESEMESIKMQLQLLEGENATSKEESARAAKLVRDLQDQVCHSEVD